MKAGLMFGISMLSLRNNKKRGGYYSCPFLFSPNQCVQLRSKLYAQHPSGARDAFLYRGYAGEAEYLDLPTLIKV